MENTDLHELAQAGNKKSQFDLGLSYLFMHDYDQAEYWLTKTGEPDFAINEIRQKINEYRNANDPKTLNKQIILRDMGSLFSYDCYDEDDNLIFSISQYLITEEMEGKKSPSAYDIFDFSIECLKTAAEMGDAVAQRVYGTALSEYPEIFDCDKWLYNAALQGDSLAIEKYFDYIYDYCGKSEDLEGCDDTDIWYLNDIISLYKSLSNNESAVQIFKERFLESALFDYLNDILIEKVRVEYSEGDDVYDFFVQLYNTIEEEATDDEEDSRYDNEDSHEDDYAEHCTTNVEIEIILNSIDGEDEKGHAFVDLGLPSGTKWAVCNIGADSPEDLGEQYAWGAVESQIECDESNLITYNKSELDLQNEGIIDENLSLTRNFDAATKERGKAWRMPNLDDIKELRNPDNCIWTEAVLNNVSGRLVTSKINGKSIFLPTARYWSSSMRGGKFGACCMSEDGWVDTLRSNTFFIRPVAVVYNANFQNGSFL